MKTLFFLSVTIGSLLSSAATVACESVLTNTSVQALTIKQAEGKLNRALMSIGGSRGDLANVDDIDCYLQSQTELLPSLKEVSGALTKLGRALDQAGSIEESRMAINIINAKVARDAGSGFVMLPKSDQETIQINLYAEVIGTHCNDEASLMCNQATTLAKNLWWVAGEYRAFADSKNASDKIASLAFNQRLDNQWRSYKDDTIKLWPQEVLLNSLVYRTSDKGLSAPPSYKLLGLRPSLGLSYLSDQRHRIQPTLNLDILGVYWWRYGGDNGVTAQPGRGISASLVWDGDDTAYGMTYHHNPKWSATIAHGDENDVVFSISFQLAHWLVAR